MPDNYNNIWWAVDGVLAGMGIPYVDAMRRMNFGGELTAYADDLPLLYNEGVRVVVSLLNHPADSKVFETAGFVFKCLPIPDGHPPSFEQAREFVLFVEDCRAKNLPVAVHCIGGIGRTGTMLCCYLIHKGMTAAEALARVRSQEPSAVETDLQLRFLQDFESLSEG